MKRRHFWHLDMAVMCERYFSSVCGGYEERYFLKADLNLPPDKDDYGGDDCR